MKAQLSLEYLISFVVFLVVFSILLAELGVLASSAELYSHSFSKRIEAENTAVALSSYLTKQSHLSINLEHSFQYTGNEIYYVVNQTRITIPILEVEKYEGEAY